MRKATLLAAAATFALGLSTARADVYVDIDVYKSVDINIIELVTKLKLVALDVIVHIDPDDAAESSATSTSDNDWNRACENCAEKSDLITNSINDNSGIVSVNQASGNMNNQGTRPLVRVRRCVRAARALPIRKSAARSSTPTTSSTRSGCAVGMR